MYGFKQNRTKRSGKAVSAKRTSERKRVRKPLESLAEPIKKTSSKHVSWQERLALLFAYDVGIDLGTANILVYVKGKGIVLDEPSCVAKNTHTGEIIAVGRDAHHMIGRTPPDIEVIRPLRAGVIDDYDTTEYMLRYFVRRAISSNPLFSPRILLCVPSGITSVEKRAVLEASLQAGARKTVLIEEPLAAALGTQLDKAKVQGSMVVDVGGGTTDIAVLCNTGVVVSESLRIGGDCFDEALIYYMKKKRKVTIGRLSAETLKIAIGTADRKSELRERQVCGQDLVCRLPKAVTVTSKEIQRAVEAPVLTIIERIKAVLEKTPPELVADIVNHGILLTGGGAMLDGFDRLLTRSLGIPVYLADNPRYSVVLGTGRALQEMEHLQDTLEELQ